jgi:hypothetical protein
MWLKSFVYTLLLFTFVQAHKAVEAQLYEDLLFDYNKIPRPVKNSSEVLIVDVASSLIRIVDVDEKNQILTLMLWLELKWIDAKLRVRIGFLSEHCLICCSGNIILIFTYIVSKTVDCFVNPQKRIYQKNTVF